MSAFDLDLIGGEKGLRALIEVIESAGRWAANLQGDAITASVERKGDDSPVTIADGEVERRVRAFLETQFPEAGFLGEETGEAQGDDGGLRFIVDPIDGTRAFMRGLDTWSILVGAELAGEPVLGIACMPALEETFVGYLGGGAYLHGERLQVTGTQEVRDALVCHGGLEAFLEAGCADSLLRVANEAYTCRGFADFDGYRRMLLGTADAMVDPGIQPYDICPAYVLLKEAGGRLTSLEGEDTLYGGSSLGTNGFLHESLLQIWAGGDPS